MGGALEAHPMVGLFGQFCFGSEGVNPGSRSTRRVVAGVMGWMMGL
jgi:hypothetical protein